MVEKDCAGTQKLEMIFKSHLLVEENVILRYNQTTFPLIETE
jgi:hypothetical protein